MLINLSNHPSREWPLNQSQAATQEFGQIKDIAFPIIDPSVEKEVIQSLALEYAQQCIQQFNNLTIEQLNNGIHIMGELTFCFTLVGLLQKQGIRCVASTTERIVTQNGNTRTSEFAFVRFRDYPTLSDL